MILIQGCTKFYTVAPNICFLIMYLTSCHPLAAKNSMLLLDFWKICAPIINPLLVCVKHGMVLVTNNDYNVANPVPGVRSSGTV